MSLRVIDIADGFSSSAVPSDLQIQASSFVNFPSSADFVADKGSSAAEGDIFFNTTTNQVEQYLGGAWVPQINELIKSFLTLVDGDTLPINTKKTNQTIYVCGNIAPITLANEAFGSSRPKDGTLITVVGLHDTKTVSLNFQDSADCLYMNFPARTLGKGQSVTFRWVENLLRYVDVGANF